MLFVAVIGLNINSQASGPVVFQVKTGYRIVTAPTSPNNIQSMQNLMDYMVNGWSVGFIDTDLNHPAAMNNPQSYAGARFVLVPPHILCGTGQITRLEPLLPKTVVAWLGSTKLRVLVRSKSILEHSRIGQPIKRTAWVTVVTWQLTRMAMYRTTWRYASRASLEREYVDC